MSRYILMVESNLLLLSRAFADFTVFLSSFFPPLRATGDDTRSLCTTVCKWTYLGHAHMQQLNGKDSRNMETCGWDDDFWEEIGLGDLVDGHHAKIGMLLGVLCILFFQ